MSAHEPKRIRPNQYWRGEHVREERSDTYDGLEISAVVEVSRTAQLLPRLTYHSIDFKQLRLTTALYSFQVSLTLKKQIRQF